MNTKIVIVPLINGKEHGRVVQDKKFDFGLKIINYSNDPSPEFDVQRICMASAEGYNYREEFNKKSFFIKTINPGGHQIVNIGATGQPLCGLVDLKATIIPKVQSTNIEIYQKSPYTGAFTETGKNRWIDFLYIKSLSEDEHTRATKWMMILTWVILGFTAIQAVSIILELFSKQ